MFVAILCTNLAGQAPAQVSNEHLTPIASINKSLLNQEITVQAVVGGISRPHEGGPYYVALTQGGATIPLIYWSSMQAQIGPKLKAGNLVRAKVKVSVYQDQLQLRIGSADALEVISSAAGGATTNVGPAATAPAATTPAATAPAATTPPQPAPTETVIGKIKADWVDRAVLISGTVSGSETKGTGWQLKVQDATGEIPVVLGEKTMAGLAVAQVQPGWVVTVTGPVKVYEGKPAVVPEVTGAVKITPQ
ncbi:MAG: hypothetical protein ACLP0A_18330 [Verrucomicrobiia bacterium]